ncbi:hypothetical protein BDM02DRAFT_3156981 [Thelephora ganbajun]|uniref:Uncharacterized protein n=1 Tax=Thelephora ganbajun TaxID=370292 RepID=A0ACB6Z6Y0_THEGA|nr:hypothetical protein BDM02DRAFT_3156981 [Thelephora ganbajun]
MRCQPVPRTGLVAAYCVYRRHNTGDHIGFTRWGEVMERDYGTPYYHVHRADLHTFLYGLVVSPVTIPLGSTVVGCDPVSPSVTLERIFSDSNANSCYRGGECNFVLLHKDDGVCKWLGFAQLTLKWCFTDQRALDNWIHGSGCVILLGDASLIVDIRTWPYRARGAAMVLEDGAVFANLLSRISHLPQLRPLEAYRDLRLHCTAMAQETSRQDRYTYNLPDGPEQRERDENMRRVLTLELSGSSRALLHESVVNRKYLNEKEKRDALFGYDADAEIESGE